MAFEKKEIIPGRSFHFSVSKKLFYFFIGVLIIVVLILLGSFFTKLAKDNIYKKIPVCGDGSFPGTCSLSKPYYCSEEGVLIKAPDKCGCSDSFDRVNNFCVSNYETDSKKIILNYTLKSENKFLEFNSYNGFNNYLYSVKQSIFYSNGKDSSRADFKLNKIDNELQREFLMPLVVQIQNLGLSKDDQARVAISLVQNIPFGESNKTFIFGNQDVPYSRYPYQVLYDHEGVCGEKTELLAFLLREIGYGVSFFYYPDENHEALGIKCPVEESFSSTGYCFVETTAPAIISDDEIIYSGIGKLNSIPELFFISEGLTFGLEEFYEYRDSRKLQRIRNAINGRGWVGPLMKKSFENLKKKYGLADEYYSG